MDTLLIKLTEVYRLRLFIHFNATILSSRLRSLLFLRAIIDSLNFNLSYLNLSISIFLFKSLFNEVRALFIRKLYENPLISLSFVYIFDVIIIFDILINKEDKESSDL